MTATHTLLADEHLSLTAMAQAKMAELVADVEDDIEGVRVYATPGGCSGISFGMTFTDQLAKDDSIREFEQFKVIVDAGTLEHIKGVEIDFTENNGSASFVFNNIQKKSSGGGGCGSCGSSSGGCSS